MDTRPHWVQVLALTLGELAIAVVALPLYVFLVLPKYEDGMFPGFQPVIAAGVDPLLAVLATLCVVAISVGAIFALVRVFGPERLITDEVKQLVHDYSELDFIPIYLAAGFAEEFLFRVVLIDLCGLIIASLLFTAMHIAYWRRLVLLVSVFALALLLGALYLFTGSLLLCALAHAVYNTLISCFMKRGVLPSGVSAAS